ncbi:MAG: hypothetical protein OQK98_03965 [Gammaproteobacteria bacterium]|nr:hypothetical protein [Gammaproteobacteria bacterium]
MTKKDTENKDAVTTKEDVITVTETETSVKESVEAKSKTANGFFLRAGTLAVFVGIAALIIGSVWSTHSTDIIAILESTEGSSDVIETSSVNTLTNKENAIAENTFNPTETMASTAPVLIDDFSKNNQQAFQDMRARQRETITNNLQKQREMMKAAFEKSDKQRQLMMEFARNRQTHQTAAFQQPAFKQDPMFEVMETHRVEMMKLMEERRQKFISEMNQAHTTKS